MMRSNRWILAIVLLLLVAGCRQQPPEVSTANLNIDLRVEPESPTVGAALLVITVTDADGSPVENAHVSARGDMNHAGMVPVLAEAESSEAGEYSILFEWTMAGDWFVEVTVELPDGETVSEIFELLVAADASGAMMDMDMTEEAVD